MTPTTSTQTTMCVQDALHRVPEAQPLDDTLSDLADIAAAVQRADYSELHVMHAPASASPQPCGIEHTFATSTKTGRSYAALYSSDLPPSHRIVGTGDGSMMHALELLEHSRDASHTSITADSAEHLDSSRFDELTFQLPQNLLRSDSSFDRRGECAVPRQHLLSHSSRNSTPQSTTVVGQGHVGSPLRSLSPDGRAGLEQAAVAQHACTAMSSPGPDDSLVDDAVQMPVLQSTDGRVCGVGVSSSPTYAPDTVLCGSVQQSTEAPFEERTPGTELEGSMQRSSEGSEKRVSMTWKRSSCEGESLLHCEEFGWATRSVNLGDLFVRSKSASLTQVCRRISAAPQKVAGGMVAIRHSTLQSSHDVLLSCRLSSTPTEIHDDDFSPPEFAPPEFTPALPEGSEEGSASETADTVQAARLWLSRRCSVASTSGDLPTFPELKQSDNYSCASQRSLDHSAAVFNKSRDGGLRCEDASEGVQGAASSVCSSENSEGGMHGGEASKMLQSTEETDAASKLLPRTFGRKRHIWHRGSQQCAEAPSGAALNMHACFADCNAIWQKLCSACYSLKGGCDTLRFPLHTWAYFCSYRDHVSTPFSKGLR